MRVRRSHAQLLRAAGGSIVLPASRRGFLIGSAKVAGGGALALAVAGAPRGRGLRSAMAQSSNFTDDLDVFNYALTLEHLENAFYRDGLDEFDEAAFEDAGYDAEVREFFELISQHEQDHVDTITATIEDAGGEPVEELEYAFGYEDVDGFVGIAQVLENVGTQAYTGAAPYIQDKGLLTAALTIHGVEARHAAYLNVVTGADVPFPSALEPGLTRDEVLAAAGPFIVSEDMEGDEAEGTPEA